MALHAISVFVLQNSENRQVTRFTILIFPIDYCVRINAQPAHLFSGDFFFLSFNFYWTKSNNHYKDHVFKQLYKKQWGKKRKEKKEGQSSLIAQEFYITNICTNTGYDIIQWNLAIKRSDTTKPSHNLTRQPRWTQALYKFLCFFIVTQCETLTHKATSMSPRTSPQRGSTVQVKSPVSIFENVKQVYPFFCR